MHMLQQALVVKIERGFSSSTSALLLTCYAATNHNYLQRYFCVFVIFHVSNGHRSVVRGSRELGKGFRESDFALVGEQPACINTSDIPTVILRKATASY